MTISTSTHGSTESAHEGEECRHRWAIETPSGKFSTGVCNLCGEKRQFQNYIEGSLGAAMSRWINSLDPPV